MPIEKVISATPGIDIEENSKPIQLLFLVQETGKVHITDHVEKILFKESDMIVYLGNCKFRGDIFAVYIADRIDIYYGNYNSGRYEKKI